MACVLQPRWVENTERTNKWQKLVVVLLPLVLHSAPSLSRLVSIILTSSGLNSPAFYSADPTAIFSGVVVFADQVRTRVWTRGWKA